MSVVPPGSVGSAISDAVEWLGGAAASVWNGLDRVWEILAELWPPVVAVVATVALLRIIRWLLLLWRGRRPRVQVSSFAWAKSSDADSESTWVTSLFREQLAALQLDGLDPLPERAPGAPLVEIVEGVGQGVSRDISSAVGRVFKAIWPDSAYEVWGTLRPREGGGGRISVQLIERRGGNRTLLSVALEQTSWEAGARAAAMAVAGALYPRIRERHRGPWTRWKTHPVPGTLIDHYHTAREHEEEHRLEQALGAYSSALEEDPLNPDLRLKIARLQEHFELYLDAWATYEAIVGEASSRDWRGADRRVYLLALYRLSVLLSNGRVAAQWVKGTTIEPGEGSLRDLERDELREELMGILERDPIFTKGPHFAPTVLPVHVKGAISSVIRRFRSTNLISLLRTVDHDVNEPNELLEVFRAKGEQEERRQRIEAVLQILSLRRLEQLQEWQRMTLRRPEFARSAIRTSKLFVRTRIAASFEGAVNRRYPRAVDPDEWERWTGEIRAAHRAMTKRWPFPSATWRRQAIRSFALPRYLAVLFDRANRREGHWQLYYNAACATASLLRENSVFGHEAAEAAEGEVDRELRALAARIERKDIVDQAMSLLDKYVKLAGSEKVVAQADWVATEDPDLRELRHTSAFQVWASHHLPGAFPGGSFSHKADIRRFTVRVMYEGALAFAAAWRTRASQTYPAATEVAGWWRFEALVWSAFAKASREHLSWRGRLEWLGVLEEWSCSAKVEHELDFSHRNHGPGTAISMSGALFDALAELAGDPGSNGTEPNQGTIFAWANARAQEVRAAHAHGEDRADERGQLRIGKERAEALRAARLWACLAEALEAELEGSCGEESDEQLRERMESVRVELNAS